eukprot:148078-Chlamydomonas_euryale.AAC.1
MRTHAHTYAHTVSPPVVPCGSGRAPCRSVARVANPCRKPPVHPRIHTHTHARTAVHTPAPMRTSTSTPIPESTPARALFAPRSWVVQTFSQALTGSAWLPKDLNQGRLDLFFLLMMVLMVANTAAFVAVAINYQYK